MRLPSSFFTKKKIILVVVLLVIAGWFFLSRLKKSSQQQSQVQTAQVEKGTLVVTVTGSGQIASTNNTAVNTEASGVVSKVFVTDGSHVKAGDKIAEIDLDLEGKQRAAQGLANYQSAKNTVQTAQANFFSLHSDMLTKWKSYMDIAQSGTYQNADGTPNTDTRQLPQFFSTNDDWLAAEAKYKNQQDVLVQAKTAEQSAWLSYQQSSPIIFAPISGTITGFSLQLGAVITSVAQPSTTTTTQGQKVASIKTNAAPTVSINLTEIDVPRIKAGNKATVTFDALPGKTFTGSVVSIDTIGAVSSGVTTYPTVIKLDTGEGQLLSNMSASASIIVDTKDNVLLIPSSAIQNQNGQPTVRLMKNGQQQSVIVEVGDTSDAESEIISGLKEGDVIVTSTLSNKATTQRSTQSPFSAFGGGGFRGGAAIRGR